MKRYTRERMWVISVILLVFVLMTSGCDLYDSEPKYPERNEPQIQIGYLEVHNNFMKGITTGDLTIFFSLVDSNGERIFNKTRVSPGTTYDCGSFIEGSYSLTIYTYQNFNNTNPQVEAESATIWLGGGSKKTYVYP